MQLRRASALKSTAAYLAAAYLVYVLVNLYCVGSTSNLKNILLRPAFSAKFQFSTEVAFGMFKKAFPRTFILFLSAFLLASLVGIILGMLFSFRGGRGKRTLQVFSLTLPVSIPDVMVILTLQLIMYSLKKSGLPFLPMVGYKSYLNLILPVISLAIIPACYIARVTYTIAVDAYSEKFITTAAAKGAGLWRIHFVHVWNRIKPGVIESLQGSLPIMMSNLLVVEILYYYPGMAYSLYYALPRYNYKVLLFMVYGLGFLYIAMTLLLHLISTIIKKAGVKRSAQKA